MKITKVEIFPLTKLRYKRPFKISRGFVGGPQMKWGFHVVIKIHTDEGLVGFGEARPNNPHQHETTWSVVAALHRFYGPALINRDPFDIEAIMEEFDKLLPENYHARTVVDFALYDLMGKATGKPVYKLIGGLVNKKVYVKFPIGQGTPEEMVAEAQRITAETGSNYFKIKIGQPERIKQDIINVAAVRKAMGDNVHIQVDANAGYKSFSDALYILRRLEEYNIILIEQPLPKWDLEGMAKLTSMLDTPILADESVFSQYDAMKIVKQAAADVINIKMPKSGGIFGAKRIAHIAEAAGLQVFIGSTTETGIGSAGGVHFYASTPNVWPWAACLFGTYMLVDDMVTDDTAFKIRDGYVEVPDRPGLGVTLDEEALKQYSEECFTVEEGL
jgi:L-alanine-DL-glutamate epimerase-like enolase superfamily enzyme